MPKKPNNERYSKLENEARMAAAGATDLIEKAKQEFLANHYAESGRAKTEP